MFQSEVTLDAAGQKAIRALLAHGDGPYADHKLVWTLFPDADPAGGDDPGRTERLFLYQVVNHRPFTALIRSAVAPVNALGCWSIRTAPFAPVPAAGDRLMFRLQVVATTARSMAGGRSKPQDVVVAAWWKLPEARRRQIGFADLAPLAGAEWLVGQGPKHGFAVDEDAVMVQSYEQQKFRGRGGRPITFGVLEMCGRLQVTDPEGFADCLRDGLGRAKGFGYGMLHVAREVGCP